MYTSTALIANNLEIEIELPFDIVPGVCLRVPTEEEVEKIRELNKHSSGDMNAWWIPYEAIISRQENGGLNAEHSPNPKDWRYWVLYDKDGGASINRIESAARLLSPSIELGVRLFQYPEEMGNGQFGYSYNPPHIMERYRLPHNALKLPNRFDFAMAAQLTAIDNSIQALPDEFGFIRNALKVFDDLSRISDQSRLKIIGYFSVIESLITHAPRLQETLDSISHQIRGKAKLMRKRFELPLEQTEAFGDLAEYKLWSKLYAYRSRVAHGGSVQFDSDLAALVDNQTVRDFLQGYCKALLIESLREPEFAQDLREC